MRSRTSLPVTPLVVATKLMASGRSSRRRRPRARARRCRSRSPVLRASTARRPSCRRSSPPAWRCLLAEPALQLTDMVMGRTQLGGRNHLLAGAAGGQRALRHQPAPGEELVASDAMTRRDERDRVAGQIRLFDDPHLLLRRPVAPPLHRRDHLDAFGAGRASRNQS